MGRYGNPFHHRGLYPVCRRSNRSLQFVHGRQAPVRLHFDRYIDIILVDLLVLFKRTRISQLPETACLNSKVHVYAFWVRRGGARLHPFWKVANVWRRSYLNRLIKIAERGTL